MAAAPSPDGETIILARSKAACGAYEAAEVMQKRLTGWQVEANFGLFGRLTVHESRFRTTPTTLITSGRWHPMART